MDSAIKEDVGLGEGPSGAMATAHVRPLLCVERRCILGI